MVKLGLGERERDVTTFSMLYINYKKQLQKKNLKINYRALKKQKPDSSSLLLYHRFHEMLSVSNLQKHYMKSNFVKARCLEPRCQLAWDGFSQLTFLNWLAQLCGVTRIRVGRQMMGGRKVSSPVQSDKNSSSHYCHSQEMNESWGF